MTTNHDVTIDFPGATLRVTPTPLDPVYEGDTVTFTAQGTEARVEFPDGPFQEAAIDLTVAGGLSRTLDVVVDPPIEQIKPYLAQQPGRPETLANPTIIVKPKIVHIKMPVGKEAKPIKDKPWKNHD